MSNAHALSNANHVHVAPRSGAPALVNTRPRVPQVGTHADPAPTAFHHQVSNLMTRYAAGDERAFAAFHALMKPRLGRLCGAMVGPRDEEDALQEVFLKLHRSRGTFVPSGNAVAWAYAVARSACLDRLRVPARTRELAMDHEQLEAQCSPLEPVDGADSSDHAMREALQARLAALSESLRLAYGLVKLDGLSCAQAAQVLGISVSAVKQRLHRATDELRAAIRAPVRPSKLRLREHAIASA